MTRNDVQLLYEYDRWANHRVLQAVSTLSAEQLTRDLGGSFRSVRDTVLHIIGGEWGWLTYWKAPPHFQEPVAHFDISDPHLPTLKRARNNSCVQLEEGDTTRLCSCAKPNNFFRLATNEVLKNGFR